MSSFASSSFKRSLIWGCKFCLHTCAIYNLEFVVSECASCNKEKNYILGNESLLVDLCKLWPKKPYATLRKWCLQVIVQVMSKRRVVVVGKHDVCKWRCKSSRREELLWLESMMFTNKDASHNEEKSCLLHAAASQVVCPPNLCDVRRWRCKLPPKKNKPHKRCKTLNKHGIHGKRLMWLVLMWLESPSKTLRIL